MGHDAMETTAELAFVYQPVGAPSVRRQGGAHVLRKDARRETTVMRAEPPEKKSMRMPQLPKMPQIPKGPPMPKAPPMLRMPQLPRIRIEMPSMPKVTIEAPPPREDSSVPDYMKKPDYGRRPDPPAYMRRPDPTPAPPPPPPPQQQSPQYTRVQDSSPVMADYTRKPEPVSKPARSVAKKAENGADSAETQPGAFTSRRDLLLTAVFWGATLMGTASVMQANGVKPQAPSLPRFGIPTLPKVYWNDPPPMPDKVQVWVPSVPKVNADKLPKGVPEVDWEKTLQLEKPLNEVRQMQNKYNQMVQPLRNPGRNMKLQKIKDSKSKLAELKAYLQNANGSKKTIQEEELEYPRRFFTLWVAPISGWMADVINETEGSVPDNVRSIPDQFAKEVAELDKALKAKNRWIIMGQMDEVLSVLDGFLSSSVARS